MTIVTIIDNSNKDNSVWWGDLTWPKKTFAMLWHLRHWLQYRQLRTSIHDDLCYLTINCDTGQHSQFLRCLKILKHVFLAALFFETHIVSFCVFSLQVKQLWAKIGLLNWPVAQICSKWDIFQAGKLKTTSMSLLWTRNRDKNQL